MYLNHIKVLIKCSITTSIHCSNVFVTNAANFESKRIRIIYARIYCSYRNPHTFESNSESVTFDCAPNNYESIAGNDPEKIEKLKLIQQEIHLLVQKGNNVPTTLTPKNWQVLLTIRLKFRRYQYIDSLWRNEVKKQNMNSAKEDIPKTIALTPHIRYGFEYCTLVDRIYRHQIYDTYNWKLLQVSMYGPDILVDCSYEKFMSEKEIMFCAKQFAYMWTDNSKRPKPFNIIFCNFNSDGQLAAHVKQYLPNAYGPDFPFMHTEKHYLDLFHRDKLIYLTPDSNEHMEQYDPDSVYIIGGFTDLGKSRSVSFGKAVKDELRTAKLPLDKFFGWKNRKTLLMLNKCLAIVTDLKDGKEWDFALRHLFKKYGQH